MRRVELTPLFAAGVAGLAAWVSFGSLAAADSSTASRFGFLPALWLLPALVAAFILAARVCRLSTPASLPLFVSLLLLLPWIPGPIPPAFLLWSGAVVWAVWVVIAVAMFLAKRGRESFSPDSRENDSRPLFAAAAIAFAAYLAGGWWLSALLPGGDEPHYLVIAQSLLRDGDLKVENNYLERQYQEFYAATIRPHYLKRGTNGEIYSVHAPGLAAVVAPVFALFGYPGVVVFLAGIAAMGTTLVWRAAYLLTANRQAAWFAWSAGALSVPFFFEAFAVFPDGFGATFVLFAALPLFEPRLEAIGKRRWVAIGAALGLLPWLHTRFAILSASLGLVLFLRLISSREGRARIVPFLLPASVSAIAWFSFFRVIYGTFNPSAPYGRDTQTSAANILRGLPALWLDHQFGVLPNAPVYAFCLAGLVVLARRRARLAIELFVVAVTYLLAVSSFHMWWGGASAPARFLAPVLPLLAIPAAWLWSTTPHAATRAAGMALLVFSLMATATLAGVDGGRLAFNVRDGYARAAEWMNTSVDVPLALPSFFRHTPSEAAWRASVWIACFAVATLALRAVERRASARSLLALGTPLMFSVAVMCAMTSVWALDGASPVRSDTSQMSSLSEYSSRIRPTGFDIGARRIEPAAALFPKIAIATPIRRGAPPPHTLLLVPSIVPGGEYQLRTAAGTAATGTAQLVIGREARPTKTWNLGTDFRDGVATFRLPVSVGSLAILGDASSPLAALTLHPRSILERGARLTANFARRVERYGPAQVFFFDLDTFPEEPGFWVKGARTAEIVVSPEDRSTHLRIFLRNAAAVNRVSLQIDGEEEVLDLEPREERLMHLPVSEGRHGALVRITSDSGFRPIEVDPGSRDSRYLGVWIELR